MVRGYVGMVTVTNDTTTRTSWRVEFDLPADTISSRFSAAVTREGGRYIFTNRAWNGWLDAGLSPQFGFGPLVPGRAG